MAQITLNSSGVASSGALVLQSNGTTTAVTIDASQNVGIGVASPQRTLHVENSSGNLVRLNNSSSANGSYSSIELTSTGGNNCQIRGVQDSSTAGHLEFYTLSASAASERMRITSAGEVGIGLTPSSGLTSGGGGGSLSAKGVLAAGGALSTNQTSMGVFQYASNETTIRSYGATAGTGSIVFNTGGGGGSADAERARIDTSGNLLVGATSTISVAGVSADHALVGTTGNGRWATAVRNTGNSTPWGLVIQYSAAAPNNTSQNFLYCYDTVTERCSIRSNGGVANYSANDFNLASDLRLKHDIEPVQSYWNVFKSIEWKTWLYNDQTDEIKNIGVIAQELQALAPELVCESNALPTPEGESPYLGLWENDFKMAGMSVITELVKRCEEQQAIITQLQADVAALKGTA